MCTALSCWGLRSQEQVLLLHLFGLRQLRFRRTLGLGLVAFISHALGGPVGRAVVLEGLLRGAPEAAGNLAGLQVSEQSWGLLSWHDPTVPDARRMQWLEEQPR